MCTYVSKEGWKARAVRGCVSFPGLLYSVLQTRGLKTTEIYSPEILKAYKSELEVSAASLWAARGGSFLAASSWQSLGFQAARLHPSHLCLCEHVAISPPLFKWSSLCVSVSSSIFPTPWDTPQRECDLIMTWSSLQRPYFQKGHILREQGLGLRHAFGGSWGDTDQPLQGCRQTTQKEEDSPLQRTSYCWVISGPSLRGATVDAMLEMTWTCAKRTLPLPALSLLKPDKPFLGPVSHLAALTDEWRIWTLPVHPFTRGSWG